MPFTYEDKTAGSPFFLDQLQSSSEDVFSEQQAISFEENPVMAFRRLLSLAEDRRTGKRLTKAEAEVRMQEYGVSGHLQINDMGITENALLTLMSRKKTELRRQEIFARSEGGFGQGIGRLAVGLGTSIIDPVNIASAFVPVMGQTRYARMLATRGSLGRVGVRAGVGAVEGAAGAAMVEPLIYASHAYEQADYDSVDSMMNASFGGLFGSVLHTGFGGIRDFGRGQRLKSLRAQRANRKPGVITDLPDPPPRFTMTDQVTPEQLAGLQQRYKTSADAGETGDKAIAVDYLSRVPEDEGFEKMYVLNSKGEIVAGVSYRRSPDGSVYGFHLGSVDNGAGRHLIKQLIQRAKDEGAPRIYLEARTGSEKFHERMGFKTTDTEGQYSLELGRNTGETPHVQNTRQAVGQLGEDQPVDVVRATTEPSPDARVVSLSTKSVAAAHRGDIEKADAIRDQLWDAHSTGSTAVDGVEDPALHEAKALGVSTTDKADFDNFMDEYTVDMSPDWPRVVEGTRGPDPEVVEAVRQAEELPKEVPSDPVDALDESMANEEAELTRLEKELGIEPADIPPEDLEIEQFAKKASDWSKAAEIATSCILQGVK